MQILENGVDTASEPSTSGCYSNVSQKNDLEQRVECTSREIQMLYEQHNTLLNLKQKAENKIRDARHIQEKLLMAQHEQKYQNQRTNLEQITNSLSSPKNVFENDSEVGAREPEEISNSDLPEILYAQVNSLQQKLNMLHNSNEGRTELIQVLDNRDLQLQSEHVQLQEKLIELQNKKMQVDRLVSQLHIVDDDVDDDDIGIVFLLTLKL